MIYRVVTTNVPDGAAWKSVEVSRHQSLWKAVEAFQRLDREGKPRVIQARLFAGEPWHWCSEAEVQGWIKIATGEIES